MNDRMFSDIFNEEEQIDILKTLIRIPSESPGNLEEQLALEIKNILNKEGIPSYLKYVDKKRTNVYAILEGKLEGKTLLYNGHLDTVPAGENWTYGAFSAYEDKEGYIYGRGAADMKSGVAAMLYAAICLKRMGYPKKGKLILFFNADEEATNLGMKQFLEENITANYAIISEPTDLDVNIGHKGASRYLLKTIGRAGHASAIENPDNAIEKMNQLLSILFQYSRDIKIEKRHDFLGSARSNVTVIKGGVAANIIPDKCTAVIDRRVLPGETRESILKEYKELFFKKAKNIDYEIENTTFLASSLINENHILPQTVFEIAKEHKQNVKIKAFEATCEAPFFSVEKNIPTVIYGPGTLKQAHVVDEKVHRSQVITAGKDFIKICISLLEK